MPGGPNSNSLLRSQPPHLASVSDGGLCALLGFDKAAFAALSGSGGSRVAATGVESRHELHARIADRCAQNPQRIGRG